MGEILYAFFVKASKIGGIKGRIKLAEITKINSTEAKEMADKQEIVHLFEEGIKKIEKDIVTNKDLLDIQNQTFNN